MTGNAVGICQQVLAGLPELLERFVDTALERGTHVHWASSAVEARDSVARVVQAHQADLVVSCRSPVTTEIGLDRALDARGVKVIDVVDLVGAVGVEAGGPLVGAADEGAGLARKGQCGALSTVRVGITGANLAVAETGSVVLVTDDGPGRLVTAMPRVHVVVVGMDRLVASWDQADLLLGMQASALTGRRLAYTTIVSGPRGRDELDGPDDLHVVVLDNGRSGLSSGPQHQTLGCACDHACPDGLVGRHDIQADRAAWRIWAAAWSDARRYAATTRAATWSRLAAGLAGRLPVAPSWTVGRALPTPVADRFRDRWGKGLV